MIDVGELILNIRIDEKDINEVKYSDWEIINAINKALRFISIELSQHNADISERSIIYGPQETENGAPFPKDFITLQRVTKLNGYELHPATNGLSPTTYLVTNNKLYAHGPVMMRYKGALKPAEKGGEIELPYTSLDLLASTTKMILNNEESSVVHEYISQLAKQEFPRRKYSNLKVKMPFRV